MQSPGEETFITTDVLVVGGGLAGVFAAVKAREQGAEVTLVSKGQIGRSGQTPWADATFVFSSEWEPRFGEIAQKAYQHGEYLNNREWTERVFRESYARFEDLAAWGVPFVRDETGKYPTLAMRGEEMPGRLWTRKGSSGDWVDPLRRKPREIGVRVFERLTIVGLLKQGAAVVGAVGISPDRPGLHVFRAKATVLCMGAGGFKPVGAWPLGDLTADGHVLAYKAGAEISGKEFEDFHNLMIKKTGQLTLPNFERGDFPFEPAVDAEGNEPPEGGFGLYADFAAHAGKAPLRRGEEEYFSGVALGMSVHTAEGVWPADEFCSAGIPGLYAAGDNCATYIDGAQYGLPGSATATASVTGARAGLAAARHAGEACDSRLDEQELSQAREAALAPARRAGGFSPEWVTEVLRNAMTPYFISRVKHGERLVATLTLVEFMRDHLCPRLYARDAHQLRLAHEAHNMVVNAEMRLRASLYRTESRGTHYREDYPRRSDPDWLAWVTLKEVDGRMAVGKKPVPAEWWPDLDLPYEQRYPGRFPGETQAAVREA